MWPESRPDNPKHFLPLIDGKCLFELNYEALKKNFKPEDIFVNTIALQIELVKKFAPDLPESNIIIEPEMRNTGPSIGLIAAMLYRQDPDEPFFLIQTDVIRKPTENLFLMMEVCEKLARETDKYITGGIKPPYAIMGIDYFIRGEKVVATEGVNVYKVAKFVWRGAKEEIEEFVKKGDALTHSNHTCMTPRNYLKMYKKYRKDWYEPLLEIANGGEIGENFSKMPSGVQELLTQQVHANGESLVVELPFEWVDFGTWESLDIYLKRMEMYKNIGKVVEIEAGNNFIRSEKPVAIIGLNDLVVVDSPNGLLICRKDQSGRVGEVVEKLKE